MPYPFNAIFGGQRTLSVLPEATHLTQSGTFQADKEAIATSELSVDIKPDAVENPTSRTQDQGEGEAAYGLVATNSSFSLTTPAVGLGTPSTSGAAPTLDALAILLASCMGEAPRLIEGSTVKTGSTPTTTSVEITDAANVEVGDVVGFINPTTAKVQWRRIDNKAVDVLTLNMALDEAPAVDSTIFGSITHKLTNSADYPIQGDILNVRGAASAQNYEFLCSVGSFTLPEAAVGEAQMISFQHKVGAANFNVTTAAGDPQDNRLGISAGGEFLLAKFGSTDALKLRFVKISVEQSREYVMDPYGNSDDGIGGWMAKPASVRVMVYVHDDQGLPPGFTASTWLEAFKIGGEQNRFHGQFNWGQGVAGNAFGLPISCMHLVSPPVEADVNEIAAIKLTFGLTRGYGGTNKLRVFRG